MVRLEKVSRTIVTFGLDEGLLFTLDRTCASLAKLTREERVRLGLPNRGNVSRSAAIRLSIQRLYDSLALVHSPLNGEKRRKGG